VIGIHASTVLWNCPEIDSVFEFGVNSFMIPAA
jgi:hypothetical protein